MHFRIYDHALIAQRRLLEREQAYTESVSEDLSQENATDSSKVEEPLEQQATIDTHLSDSNVGFRLLQKMGWKGKGLGKDEQGMLEPIKSDCRDAKLGVGKQEEDNFYTAETNIHRKRMDAEVTETEEVVKKREVEAERELKIESEVKEIRKAFFCDLCNKQYKFAVEFETHLSSYDHNHRKRFKDMRDLHSTRDREERQKREQLRHDKEMAKQQAEAQRQQQEQIDGKSSTPPRALSTETPPPSLSSTDNKSGTVRFGFLSSRSVPTKVSSAGSVSKKLKVVAKVPSIFAGESDDDET